MSVLPSAPTGYDVRDQNALRQVLEDALRKLTAAQTAIKALQGTSTVVGGITQLTGDVTAVGPGSVAATIAAGAVTTAKIAAGAVTTNELGALAVTTAKIAAGAVTTNELGALAVTTAKIAAGAVTTNELGAKAVTLAKMDDMATASLIYRKTSGTGTPEVNTLATLKTDLGLTGTNSGDQTITLTSDVTGGGTGSFATTIAAGVVTNAKLATMAAHTLKANITGSTAAPVDSSLSAILDAELSSTQGVIIYRAASNWATLAVGTSGYVLQTGGAAANPSWLDLTTLYYTKTQIDTKFSGPFPSNDTFDPLLEWLFVPGTTYVAGTTAAAPQVHLQEAKKTLYYARTGASYQYNKTGYIEKLQDSQLPISWISGTPYAFFGAAATNVCQWSDDLSQWTLINSPTLTSGQTDPYGTSKAYNISDTSGSTSDGVKLAIGAFSVNGAAKGVIFCIKKGSSSAASGTRVGLFDSTSSVYILDLTITWSGGVPSVATTTGAYDGAIALANGWYALYARSANWTTGHTTEYRVFPAGTAAETGDVYFCCAHAEDNRYGTGCPIQTNGVARTRAADSVNLTQNGLWPEGRTMYLKVFQMTATSDASFGDFVIGAVATSGIIMGQTGTNTQYTVQFSTNASTKSAALTGLTAMAFGQTREYRAAADNTATPAVTAGCSVNGGAETTITSATAAAYTASYTTTTMGFKSGGTLGLWVAGAVILNGVQTLAKCRTYVP